MSCSRLKDKAAGARWIMAVGAVICMILITIALLVCLIVIVCWPTPERTANLSVITTLLSGSVVVLIAMVFNAYFGKDRPDPPQGPSADTADPNRGHDGRSPHAPAPAPARPLGPILNT